MAGGKDDVVLSFDEADAITVQDEAVAALRRLVTDSTRAILHRVGCDDLLEQLDTLFTAHDAVQVELREALDA